MKTIALLICLLSFSAASAQTPNAWGYSTGYGNVYGTYGLAQTMQSMYNVARAQSQRQTARNAAVTKQGTAAAEPAERNLGAGGSSRKNSAAERPPVVRNYGAFSPVADNDAARRLAEELGTTAQEKTLIKQIYEATKAAYEPQAASRGWKNNIAGGLTFFTITAITVAHDSDEPSAEAADAHYKLINASLDALPGLATATNKDKQDFNNMLIGFAGLLIAGYSEGKETGDSATVASYRKLAGGLIQLVLKTDPENIRVENGLIVMK